MSNPVNLAESGINEEFINDFKNMQRQLRELKTTVQPVGSDNIRIGGIPSAGAFTLGPVTVLANSRFTVHFNFSPSVANLTLWNFLWTVYCDSHAVGYGLPDGASLSAGQSNGRAVARDDYYGFSASRPTAGRSLVITVENADSVSHNYYFDVYALIPLASGSPVA